MENNKVLVNPNFSGSVVARRPAKTVPSKPMRHSLMVTSDVAKHLDLQLKKVKSSAAITPRTSLNKENLPSTSKTKNLFTPLRKSAFKKIGSRKLIRRKSGSPGTPKASFKKIGHKKLIRIVDSENKNKSVESTPYDVKTKTKIIKNVKNTPSNAAKYKFSFITPLSMRKRTSVIRNSGSLKKSSGNKKKLSKFRSRFKLDRRQQKVGTKTEPKLLFPAAGASKLKKVSGSGSVYRVSATKLSRVQGPGAASKVITVQGVQFSVADNGRKLRRLPSASSAQLHYSASVSGQTQATTTSCSPQTDTAAAAAAGDSGISSRASPVSVSAPAAAKKMYVGGEELEEVEPGVFTRSRHSLTRQSITQAKNRSINTILKHQTRSKQYCMFYNKFGKCTKKEAGNCPFIHDRDKIAVCRRFLQGSCHKDNCLLSHKAAPEKMPVCKFYLEGVCSKEPCPYLHVKVSEAAAICPAFLAGFCKNGSDCKLRHVMACPEWDRLGTCSRPAGKCPFPHVTKGDKEKKVAPVKPKRKSLGQTPADHKKSRVASARYFDQEPATTVTASSCSTPAGTSEDVAEARTELSLSEMEAKRRRLLRKIELAKQGWTGVSVSAVAGDTAHAPDSLEDSLASLASGPYETIPSEEEEEVSSSRPAMGQLGDFISLAGYSSEDEEIHTDHRLI